MSAYEVAWHDHVLYLRRRGLLNVVEANEYVSAARLAVEQSRGSWGLISDLRGSTAQIQEVQDLIESLVEDIATRGVQIVAVVVNNLTTQMQQRRLSTGPGKYSDSVLQFFDNMESAEAAVAQVLAQGPPAG
ncbi:hypothetical protein acdb102_23350 [Acidothermaceae bacterium B102]|nr:hypothetical protein acdb102_23350 [Acidothermaceae bacterium B102]